MCDDVKSGKVLARELRGVRVDRVIDVYLISITYVLRTHNIHPVIISITIRQLYQKPQKKKKMIIGKFNA